MSQIKPSLTSKGSGVVYEGKPFEVSEAENWINSTFNTLPGFVTFIYANGAMGVIPKENVGQILLPGYFDKIVGHYRP